MSTNNASWETYQLLAQARDYVVGTPAPRNNQNRSNNRAANGANRTPARRRKVAKTIDYEIEEILDVRVTGERVEYFLKWKGYPDSQNSWVSIEDMKADDLIEEFFGKQ